MVKYKQKTLFERDKMEVKCEYCGLVREKDIFVIGASTKNDWCMHEGTGKMSCPDCYQKAQNEAIQILNSL